MNRSGMPAKFLEELILLRTPYGYEVRARSLKPRASSNPPKSSRSPRPPHRGLSHNQRVRCPATMSLISSKTVGNDWKAWKHEGRRISKSQAAVYSVDLPR
uniref:Uncharacterized protein n=1 Tax=Coccidioides posadasii RMSCC 3488 TaxID=454284 RepID=A0A0J6FNJ9_COCPO|nr:hypothetical protein CPAG_06820 [Coccidioides posadasii RMSCC 3488]